MKQSDEHWHSNAAEAHVGEGQDPVSLLLASGETRSDANAMSFWDRFIFALGVAPEWPCLSIWDAP